MRRYLSFCAIGFLISLSQCNHEEEIPITSLDMITTPMDCTTPKQFTVQSKGLEGTNPIEFKRNGLELFLKTSKGDESITLTSKNKLEGDFDLRLDYEDFKLADGAKIQISAISKSENASLHISASGTNTEGVSFEHIILQVKDSTKNASLLKWGTYKNPTSGHIHIKRQGTNLIASIHHLGIPSLTLDFPTDQTPLIHEFGTEPVQFRIDLIGRTDITDIAPSSILLTNIQVSDGNKIISEKFSCTP